MGEQTTTELLQELHAVKTRLEEMHDALHAIRTGRADAIVVSGPKGEQVFSLPGTDKPYRALVEAMNEGAVSLLSDGVVAYCNRAFADMVGAPRDQILGASFEQFVVPGQRSLLAMLLVCGGDASGRAELTLARADGTTLPVQLSLQPMGLSETPVICGVVTDVSEMRRSREEVRIASTRSRSLIEAAIDPMITIAPDGKITDVNRATESATGLPASMLIGTDFAGYFTDPAKARAGYQSALGGTPVREYELEIRHCEGRVTPVLYSASAYRGETGQVAGVFACARDISLRKRQEQELRLATELTEQTTQPIFVAGLDGRFARVNPAFERLTGYTADELSRMTNDDLTPEEWRDPEQRHLDAARSGGRNVRYEQEYRRKDGTRVAIEVAVELYLSAAAEAQYLYGFVTDVTERKRDQRALQTERQRFSDVLDKLPVYVILLAPDYHVPFTNQYFRSRFGAPGPRRCFEYLFGRDRPCEICETYEVLRTHEPRQWKWTGPDGCHYDIYDFPFTDIDGSTLILEMGLDITDRERAEEQIRTLNAELERRVVERTAQLEAPTRNWRRSPTRFRTTCARRCVTLTASRNC